MLCLQSDATELFVDAVAMGAEADADPQFEIPYGPTIPALYAQAACRYFHEFGITEDDLADVVIANQRWGRASSARGEGEVRRDRSREGFEFTLCGLAVAPLDVLDLGRRQGAARSS